MRIGRREGTEPVWDAVWTAALRIVDHVGIYRPTLTKLAPGRATGALQVL